VSEEELEQTIKEIKQKSLAKTDFEKAQEKVIVDQLRDPTFANLQTFCIMCRLDVAEGSDQTKFFSAPPAGTEQVSLLMCLEHPLSRGTVHITSSDPLAAPRIDPGYFRNEVDAKILAAGMKWMDQVANHPLLAKQMGRRELPAKDKTLDSEEERIDYVKNHISTQYHLIGTAAMGEVVDDHLHVNGVKGLRVVDASVFPGHVSGVSYMNSNIWTLNANWSRISCRRPTQLPRKVRISSRRTGELQRSENSVSVDHI
jgi:choline dehydrogenase-like flavoprotein